MNVGGCGTAKYTAASGLLAFWFLVPGVFRRGGLLRSLDAGHVPVFVVRAALAARVSS